MILCIQLKLSYGRNYYVLWICSSSLHITSNHGSLGVMLITSSFYVAQKI